MTKNDMRFFSFAAQTAAKSDYEVFNIGCVAVYKGKVISTGVNSRKSHPMQMKYDKYRHFRDDRTPPHTLHAEIDCLNRIDPTKYDMSKVRLYIYRPRKCSPTGISRPCPACMKRIKDLGIKVINYSTDAGYATEHIF